MKHKKTDIIMNKCAAVLLAAILMAGAGCAQTSEIQGGLDTGSTGNSVNGTNEIVQDSSPLAAQNSVNFVANTDLNGMMQNSVDIDTYDTTITDIAVAEKTVISFQDYNVTINGRGCSETNGVVTIDQAGTYVLSGTLSNGSIVVNTTKDSIVNLVLNGVSITSSDTSAIYIKKAGKTIITLAAGTTNTLTDGTIYLYEDAAEEEPSATLYSKADLTINGTGTLVIVSNFNDAIKCKDSLKLIDGTYQITSVDDGIIGKDMLVVESGTYQITAEGDGLKSSNDTDETLGFVLINGGDFTITAGADAIQAETVLNITGGVFHLTSGGGSSNAEVHGDDWGWGFWGNRGTQGTKEPQGTGIQGAKEPQGTQEAQEPQGTQEVQEPQGTQVNNTTETDSASYKGLKCGTTMRITGGNFTIDSSDDAIHSNGTVCIDNGIFQISTGDDAVHAEETLVINGGEMTVTTCYEGLESYVITLNAGKVTINASDDGINAAGGTVATSEEGWGFGGGFGGFGGGMGASQGASLIINGGMLTVIARGDGLDANGSVQINGGTVFVDGPTDSGNGALDYDTTFEITGGQMAIAGSTGMAQAPSSDSEQASVSLTFLNIQAAGTVVEVYDSNGNMILSYTPSKTFQNIVLSSPEMKVGSQYLFTYGTTEIGTIELTSAVTYLSSDGTISEGSPNGMGGMGGMGGKGGMGGNQTRPNGGRR